ncbi:DNA primase [Roseibaca sp. Y0-43]|uniref:DNA primase n=1 Tax=Roseibaca sp. Y0-43 TaxID=2816854 RepID=UPI001D0C74BA|nr:DNA primase [Roseibaca sp. Y0-43]MCC1482343.1 DNA primase [Roseibaca sp. Y0-43]
MSLPPGFLDELRNRVSISSIVGRKVIWDMRKSNQAKGDFWAPCPFHQEKTASFHVDDRKGFYYCFGCHAKGDALTFLRESENMSFMEAVELMAREAGLPMPERDPRAAEKADRLSELAEVTEAAVRFFRMQLNTSAAAGARDYLKGRALAQSALDRFEIGFAPDARQALWSALTGAGIAGDKIIEAGLCAKPDDGSAPYDRMRGRIIYPIRDGRGRCIGFGGRALSATARAKYLNSPETPLFDKGRALYNLGPARSACGKGQPLIVAEGYMDVIALVEAGFEGAVAPLGTAITEDQLRLMWRVAPEPIIALDGDTAGLRAGFRLIDLALPLLGPEQSLRFCLLPEKMDPDDILRQGGPAAMGKLIEEAVPLVQLLWRRETEGQVFDSPERRAALDKRLRMALSKIADPGLRGHYTDEIKRLRAEFLRPPARGFTPRGARNAAPVKPLTATRSTRLASAPDDAIAEAMREELIVATLICHPALLPEFEGDLERLTCRDPALSQLCAALLAGDRPDGAQADALLSLPHVAIAPPVRGADPDLARLCLRDEFAKHFARGGVEAELREVVEDLDDLADESVTYRLARATAARNESERSRLSDSTDLGEDRAALSNELQRLIESEIWVKRKK